MLYYQYRKERLQGKIRPKAVCSPHGLPGGQRFATPREWLNKKPIAILEHL